MHIGENICFSLCDYASSPAKQLQPVWLCILLELEELGKLDVSGELGQNGELGEFDESGELVELAEFGKLDK